MHCGQTDRLREARYSPSGDPFVTFDDAGGQSGGNWPGCDTSMQIDVYRRRRMRQDKTACVAGSSRPRRLLEAVLAENVFRNFKRRRVNQHIQIAHRSNPDCVLAATNEKSAALD